MLANFMGAPISDRVGRRKLMCKSIDPFSKLKAAEFLQVIGFASTLAMLAVATGLLAKYNETPTKGWAGVSLTSLFLYVFW